MYEDNAFPFRSRAMFYHKCSATFFALARRNRGASDYNYYWYLNMAHSRRRIAMAC